MVSLTPPPNYEYKDNKILALGLGSKKNDNHTKN